MYVNILRVIDFETGYKKMSAGQNCWFSNEGFCLLTNCMTISDSLSFVSSNLLLINIPIYLKVDLL